MPFMDFIAVMAEPGEEYETNPKPLLAPGTNTNFSKVSAMVGVTYRVNGH